MNGHLKSLVSRVSQTPTFESGDLSLEKACSVLSPASDLLPPEEAVPTFFKLIAKIPRSTQTKDRLAFWQRYCLSNSILQCWLCLTPSLAERLKIDGSPAFRFGFLRKDHRVQELHGVLLMRFPPFVVAEWSHQGKCRFWFLGNPHAPKLLQSEYGRDDLLSFPDHTQQHYFPAAGRWQRDAAQWMAHVLLEASP